MIKVKNVLVGDVLRNRCIRRLLCDKRDINVKIGDAFVVVSIDNNINTFTFITPNGTLNNKTLENNIDHWISWYFDVMNDTS